MIRQITRRRVGKVVALAAVVGVMSTGTPSLSASAAAASATKAESSGSPDWFLQVLNGKGELVNIQKEVPKSLAAPTPPQLLNDTAQVRRELLANQTSGSPKTAERATRLLRLLDIATAKTASERHEKIRKLPVTITMFPAADGRNGIVKNFVVGGKTRMRRFIPSVPTHTSTTAPEDERMSGPAADMSDSTGRWKLGGPGECYWDPNDEGPDQCVPLGRWKSDGQGGCYWDANDGGPDQCQPPPSVETCYDNEPAPCASEQEMEDYDIVLAQTQYELETSDAENNAAYTDYVNFCNSNPSHEGCQEGDAGLPMSGPSACEFRAGCWTNALYATEWVGVGLMNYGFRLAARAGAAAVGVRLATATVAASTIGLALSTFMAGYYVGSFIDCMFFMYAPEPEPEFSASYWYEPAYYL